VLKEVAERLREKQNASKRTSSGAAGRKDADGMDVDEPEGSEARNKNRKCVACDRSLWVRRPLPGTDDFFPRRAPQEMVRAKAKRNRM